MVEAEAIIVGGGPAGSSCAGKLRQLGINCLIVDQAEFPRPKTCAGWIQPRVVKTLRLIEENYPHLLTEPRRFNFYLCRVKIPLPVRQYAIRREEFDGWLLRRAGVPVYRHRVRKIIRRGGSYLLDGNFSCRYLVGAGGTFCPVYRAFFQEVSPRRPERLVAALAEEFPSPSISRDCYLWFFEEGLSGYSWYIPKKGGYLNIGIGGKLLSLRRRGETILDHWRSFTDRLRDRFGLEGINPHPRGALYYLRSPGRQRVENAFIVGDAAGRATLDLGEGIGPAVESGLRAAGAIAGGSEYSPGRGTAYSFPGIIFPGR